MRTAFHFAAATVLLAAIGTLTMSLPARADDKVPKELLQFVHDAKLRGVEDGRIREQAISLGWAAGVVDEAIAQATGGKRAESAASADAKPASSTQLLPSTAPPVAGAGQGATIAEMPGNRGAPDDYQIGSGDTLQISVWKELDVSVPSVVVRPDGKITVPLIKDVEVGGLTTRQAESLITEGLSKFYSDPNVTVVIAAINSKKVYIIGSVRKEGPLPYTYGMTVMQALSEAGGLTDYARRKKIYVLRTAGGREYRLDFNYDEVVRGERMEQNVLLLPGDTVVIPH
jgi:polysaccharide export outer membrane protein